MGDTMPPPAPMLASPEAPMEKPPRAGEVDYQHKDCGGLVRLNARTIAAVTEKCEALQAWCPKCKSVVTHDDLGLTRKTA